MSIGFIILRHVNNEETNKYWIYCYNRIRKFYPENKILIIDDNSNYDFITKEKLYNTVLIQSDYPGRGELLPYYYYLENKLFDKAVILHDSVFINKKLDLDVDNYKILWDFNHNSDQIEDEEIMIKIFGDDELLAFHRDKNKWRGCFGCMSIITYDYLSKINNKYNISKLLPLVLKRYNRCSLERVIACLLQKDDKSKVLFGDIHRYCVWGIKFREKDKYSRLPVVKVWSGR